MRKKLSKWYSVNEEHEYKKKKCVILLNAQE